MKNKPLTRFLLLTCLFLIGCQKYTITPENSHTVIDNGLIYSIAPYTANINQEVKIHNLLADNNLSTTFLLRIKNTNETPFWTKTNNSFILVDDNKLQYSPFTSSYPFLADLLSKANPANLSYSDIRNMNLELERLQEKEISTSNLYLYEEEFKTLQTKIYTLERNQLLQSELQKTEKEIQHIIETYGFKDQLIYPDAEILSILIFPAIDKQRNQGFVLNFTLNNNKTITIPYKIKKTN